ncbi:putative oxidoreductase [Candida maltosa Xu316]|uniref:Putative oxidoreductase n=1 Tax=Candida maltosa (strain Xu316) TaxID=1245528 RepID=M3J5P2_CANMX|nr:putative oxidoreductase [Candida maltosa Xu316]
MSKVSIAIIGLNGSLGKPVLEALKSGTFKDKVQFPIKAISRKDPETKDPNVDYVVSAIDDGTIDSISQRLAGTDVIIELTGANPDLFSKVEKIVAKVKPKLFIPSQFGTDIEALETYAPGLLTFKQIHSENVRKLGVKVVDILTSLFAVPGAFLYEWVHAVGIDPHAKTVKLIGGADSKFHVSKVTDIGNTVAFVATSDPKTLPNTVKIASDEISVQNVIDRYSKDHGIELKVVSTQPAEEAKKELIDSLKNGFNHEKFLWYLNVVLAQGLDKGLLFSKLDNELVNPGESLWKWGKY